ncbi:hypothetical protein Scep_029444 [Stephania cephalantha]|uniref:Uncharacterized protein n=1 Tax=Stephania cephalantha TaxID=152367 RepID=A0AAP0E5E0_9MAGN
MAAVRACGHAAGSMGSSGAAGTAAVETTAWRLRRMTTPVSSASAATKAAAAWRLDVDEERRIGGSGGVSRRSMGGRSAARTIQRPCGVARKRQRASRRRTAERSSDQAAARLTAGSRAISGQKVADQSEARGDGALGMRRGSSHDLRGGDEEQRRSRASSSGGSSGESSGGGQRRAARRKGSAVAQRCDDVSVSGSSLSAAQEAAVAAAVNNARRCRTDRRRESTNVDDAIERLSLFVLYLWHTRSYAGNQVKGSGCFNLKGSVRPISRLYAGNQVKGSGCFNLKGSVRPSSGWFRGWRVLSRHWAVTVKGSGALTERILGVCRTV